MNEMNYKEVITRIKKANIFTILMVTMIYEVVSPLIDTSSLSQNNQTPHTNNQNDSGSKIARKLVNKIKPNDLHNNKIKTDASAVYELYRQ